MGDKCSFCDFQSLSSRIIAQDSKFIIVPSLGQVSDGGHLLIIPKNHIACLGAMDSGDIKSVVVWKDKLTRAVKDAGYGHGAVFEHGTVGQSVPHAHLHIVPWLPNDVTDQVRKDFPSCHIEKLDDMEELQKSFAANSDPYLFWQGCDGHMFVCWNPPAKEAYFRWMIADAFGRPDRGDWRKTDKVLDAILIADTVERLQDLL